MDICANTFLTIACPFINYIKSVYSPVTPEIIVKNKKLILLNDHGMM